MPRREILTHKDSQTRRGRKVSGSSFTRMMPSQSGPKDGGWGNECFLCGKKGHFKKDSLDYKAIKAKFHKTNVEEHGEKVRESFDKKELDARELTRNESLIMDLLKEDCE